MTVTTPFPGRPTCPKCSQIGPKPTWHAAMPEALVRASCEEREEHLHWKCQTCSYEWMTKPAT